MTHTGILGVGILPSTGELRTEGGPIITCWSACIGNAETEANARLIATAPEIAKAAHRVLEWWNETLATHLLSNADFPWAEDAEWDQFADLRAALNKALGK